MRILIVNTLYYPYHVGGAEKSVQILAEELVKKNNIVYIICLYDKREVSREVVNGVNVIYLPCMNLFWSFDKSIKTNKLQRVAFNIIEMFNVKSFFILKKMIKEINPDVLHTNNIFGFSVSIWLAAKLENVRIIHTARDYYLFHPNGTLFKNGVNIKPLSLEVKLFSCIKKFFSRYVDSFVGISNYIKEIHIKNDFFRISKHSTIYNSININDNVSLESKEIRRVGFIGNISKQKGIETFLELAEILSKRKSSYEFYIAGSGNEEYIRTLKARYNSSNIYYLGFVNSNVFYKKIDCLVVPPLWNEPFGRTPIEAASFGIKVVGSKVGGLEEVLKIIGAPMFTSIDDLAYIIESNFEMGERISNLEQFESGIIADKYIDVYRKII